MTDYSSPDVRQLGGLTCPDLPGAPKPVRAALAAESAALDALFDCGDHHEDVLADDWAERLDRRLLAAAQAGEDIAGQAERAREDRARAKAEWLNRWAEAEQAAKAGRAAVIAWLRGDGGTGLRHAEADARAEVERAAEALEAARTDWLKATGVAVWSARVATAASPQLAPDYTGVESHGIADSQLARLAEHLADEQRRADLRLGAAGDGMPVMMTGRRSGIEFATSQSVAEALRREDDGEQREPAPRRRAAAVVGQ